MKGLLVDFDDRKKTRPYEFIVLAVVAIILLIYLELDYLVQIDPVKAVLLVALSCFPMVAIIIDRISVLRCMKEAESIGDEEEAVFYVRMTKYGLLLKKKD